jgi:hypothetical protein
MRERIITEIQRINNQTGQVLGVRAFEIATGILRREWTGKIWARWSDAIKEAGFEPNELTQRYDSKTVLEFVANCSETLGRLASSSDLRLYGRNNPGSPSSKTIENHFPNRSLLISALRDFSEREPSYSFLLNMLPEVTTEREERAASLAQGHVYLLRAGDYYKIGQSSDLEKRVKSINVALPDKATLEHAISTDDPPGFEAYWHRRFADRRANGEWFKLSRADVMAFKKRKFQ